MVPLNFGWQQKFPPPTDPPRQMFGVHDLLASDGFTERENSQVEGGEQNKPAETGDTNQKTRMATKSNCFFINLKAMRCQRGPKSHPGLPEIPRQR